MNIALGVASLVSIALSITSVVLGFKGKLEKMIVLWIIGFFVAIISFVICAIKYSVI